MIIAKLQGGMGNQLFQYAMARSLSLSLGDVLKVDTSFYLYTPNRTYALDSFQTEVKKASPVDEGFLYPINIPFIQKAWESIYSTFFSSNFRIIHEREQYVYKPQDVATGEDIFLIGFWQNENYFRNIEGTLRHDLTFASNLQYPRDLLSKIEHVNAVSVHVRRGDYLRSQGFSPCSAEFYSQAIAYVSSHVSKPHFFVFSDDLPWSKQHFSDLKDVTFIEYENTSDAADLFLMSRCRHHIVANSTFSWWGAWLNNRKSKCVVAPKRWLEASPKSDQIIPQVWIRI